MSILAAVGHAFQAIEGTRIGARLFGQGEALDTVSETLRPIRTQVNQERAHEMGQQMGNVQQSAPSDGDAASEPTIDTDGEGILGSIADAIEWILDKL